MPPFQKSFFPIDLGWRVHPYLDTSKVVDRIPPGVYQYNHSGEFWYVQKINFASDELVGLPDPQFTTVMEDIARFISPEVAARYAKFGMLHRRSIMLYGEPGTGKSCLIRRVALESVNRGMYAIYDNAPRNILEAVREFRRFNPDAYFLVILEEFDRWIRNCDFTEILDGGDSIDRIMFLMTTNHIGVIPDVYTKRPSRIARLIHVGPPNEEARRVYINSRLRRVEDHGIDIEAMVVACDGLVIDQIKDVILSVGCYALNLVEAVSRVKDGLFSESDKMKVLDKSAKSTGDNEVDESDVDQTEDGEALLPGAENG